MAYGIYDISIKRNKDYNKTLIWYAPDGITPINLTGFTFQGQIKQNTKAEDAIDIEITVPTPANGRINLHIDQADCELMIETICGGQIPYYVYDILFTPPGGDIDEFVRGKVRVEDGVTEWQSP